MKRLIFCFDGTWNKLGPDTATNVVLTAASILRVDAHGTVQTIHYDEGVGTGDFDQFRGGLFGRGLLANIREAYRFLVFNYDPGDEIFVFGFSRGAFSARSFVNFVRHVGPLRRLHVGRIDEAIALYRKRLINDWQSDEVREFRAAFSNHVCIDEADDEYRCRATATWQRGTAPTMAIEYLGIWDTVGAIGLPRALPLSGWFNRRDAFHDIAPGSFVKSLRHAVATDERRVLFPPDLIGDLSALNAAAGFTGEASRAPYQERWFPGDHGSVGGGGDVRGLSDLALAWVLQGARQAKLGLDTAKGSRFDSFKPDPMAPLTNMVPAKRGAMNWIERDRPGPATLAGVSSVAQRRWQTAADYRPATLAGVAAAIDALPKPDPVVLLPNSTRHRVVSGDTLGGLAARFLGDARRWPEIQQANTGLIDDPDEIFVGWDLMIPAKDAPAATADTAR